MRFAPLLIRSIAWRFVRKARRALPLVLGLGLVLGAGLAGSGIGAPGVAAAQEPGGSDASRGYLGVKVVENATTLEEIGEHTGVRVEAVVENSPAQAAGIRPGDVIESFAGRAYAWPDRFLAAVEAVEPGREVEIVILRDDASIRLRVRLGRRAAPAPAREVLHLTETERVGVKVKSLTREEARAAGLPPAEGVRLVGFWGDSPWQRDGLQRGDILHVMNDHPLHDPREFIRRVRRLEPGTAVKLAVVRDGRRLILRTVASRRAGRTERVFVPVLFNYTSKTPEESEWGLLLDVFQTRWKAGRRTTTLFWVIRWTTGPADELVPLPVPGAPDAS